MNQATIEKLAKELGWVEQNFHGQSWPIYYYYNDMGASVAHREEEWRLWPAGAWAVVTGMGWALLRDSEWYVSSKRCHHPDPIKAVELAVEEWANAAT